MFKRKHQPAPVAEFGYQDAVDYLCGLEQADYNKILKVVNTYRDADKKVKKILNIKDEPAESADLDDMDISDLLIDDDQPKKVTINKTEKPKGKKQ